MTREQTIELAKEIVAAHGGQVAVAAKLKVTQPRISQALRDKSGSDGIRLRIIREVGKYKVSEAFEVQPKKRRGKA